MYTQCPECLTVYEIDEDALQASFGIVRCVHCSTRFDALRRLSDTLPTTGSVAALPGRDPAWRAPNPAEGVSAPVFEPGALRAGSVDATRVEPELPVGTQAGENTDDWFTDIASELVASSSARPSTRSEPGPVDEKEWGVELPDGAGVAEPGAAAATDAANDDIHTVPATETSTDFVSAEAGADPGPEPASDAPESGAILQQDLALAHESDTDESGAATPTSAPHTDETEDSGTEVAAASVAAETSPDGSSVASAPVYVRPRRRFSRSGVVWTLGCACLALLLAAQLAWANRVELFRNPATHGWMVRLCTNVPCRLPLIKDTAKLELLSRDVRPDPEASGALTITATLRNDAAFGQPWPVVVVKFTDLDDNPVAMRRFRPAEYMPDPARRAAGIAPGETAAVAFEVVDPGKRATGFQFGFE